MLRSFVQLSCCDLCCLTAARQEDCVLDELVALLLNVPVLLKDKVHPLTVRQLVGRRSWIEFASPSVEQDHHAALVDYVFFPEPLF